MYKLKVVDEILRRFLEPRKRIQVIAGPRQVGKTTSVEQAVAGYHGGYTYKLAEGLPQNGMRQGRGPRRMADTC